MNIAQTLSTLSYVIVPLLFAITLHEAAHGWVAHRLGDPTASLLGRVTLDPLKHIDPVGTLAVPLVLFLATGFAFGWAKPVPINAAYFKNKKRDLACVALAGPAANMLMAFFWALILKATLAIHLLGGETQTIALFFYKTSQFGVLINCLLCALNLLPIPPLDGSRVVSACLPNKWAYFYEKIEPYGFIILMVLLVTHALNYILGPLVYALTRLIQLIIGL